MDPRTNRKDPKIGADRTDPLALDGKQLLIAQISDLHLTPSGDLYNKSRYAWDYLDEALQAIQRVYPHPDYLIVSGDIADRPLQAIYDQFREWADKVPVPVYAFPGNHDNRAMFKRSFLSAGYLDRRNEFTNYVIENNGLRAIILDSLEPVSGEALLCDTRLAWLEEKLTEKPEQPTMIFMHHQPILTRLGFLGSAEAFPGAYKLCKLLKRHKNVERISCGHLHRPIFMQLGSVPVTVAPSITYQRTLTVHNGLSKAYSAEPVSMLLHLWHPETGVVTHMHFIGDFGPDDPMLDT